MKLYLKAKSIIQFYLNAKTYKDLENVKLSELIYNILELNDSHYRIKEIESLRKSLLKDIRILLVNDLGAGSTYSKSTQRSIKYLAKTAVSPKWQCHLLYKTINEFLPSTILEIGTSLGISTSYLSVGNPHSTITTMEGVESIATIAMENFSKLRIKNTKLVYGNFDNTLSVVLNNLDQIDFAFIDGNHRKEATLEYFNKIITKSTNQTVLVFDDIHWSKGMEEAWAEIKNHKTITLSLDFYSFGMVFFNQRYGNGEHFSIIERKFKFWK